MSKGKDKKPKADKSKPKIGVSPYKAAQGTGKPAIKAFLCARRTMNGATT